MAKAAPETPDNKERTSLILRTEAIRNIKYIAFMAERTQSDVVDEALNEYVEKWEKKNGPIPKKPTQ